MEIINYIHQENFKLYDGGIIASHFSQLYFIPSYINRVKLDAFLLKSDAVVRYAALLLRELYADREDFEVIVYLDNSVEHFFLAKELIKCDIKVSDYDDSLFDASFLAFYKKLKWKQKRLAKKSFKSVREDDTVIKNTLINKIKSQFNKLFAKEDNEFEE